jgi:hypothetical protein
MKHLKIFLWNDKTDEADKWQEVIAGGGTLDNVPKSSARTPEEVVREVEAAKPDVVVLDIKALGDRKMGLDIAEGVRKADLLVPILAVTRDPKVVYLATNRFEQLGFAGVFHASVMEEGVFESIALRPSLNHWHLIAPEFPLVRHCVQSIKSTFGASDSDFANHFIQLLESLPFSRSIESWHKQIRDPLVRLMNQRSLGALGQRFKDLAELFEKADPFYMAGSRSRRHLSHNVQVFLIGLAILLRCSVLRSKAIETLRAYGEADDTKALLTAVFVWACIANTHDVAYVSEHFSTLNENLQQLTQKFSEVFGPTEQVKPMPKVNWPGLAHGEVAARLWRAGLPNEPHHWNLEHKCFQLVASAIARHDSKYFPNTPVNINQWAEFLAVLSDELQDWGRERPENSPGPKPFENITWGMFSLEGIQITEHKVSLTFVAQDHPELIARRFGTSGEDPVKETFNRIAQTLRKNLSSSVPLEIDLQVDFVSRPATLPVHESIAVQH